MPNFSKKIIINGQEYNSLDEVPEQFRGILKDDDQNSIPDFIEEGKMPLGLLAKTAFKLAGKIMVNGQKYDNIDELNQTEKTQLKNKLQQAKAKNPQAARLIDQVLNDYDDQSSPKKWEDISTTASLSSGNPANGPLENNAENGVRTTIFVAGIVAFIGFFAYQFFSGKLHF